MKKLLFATASIAALGLVAPQAIAQDQTDANLSHEYLYMERSEAGDYRVFGPDFPAEGQQVLYEGGMRPAECPEGAWFIEHDEQTGEFDQVRGCVTEDDLAYGVEPMTEDLATTSGYAEFNPSAASGPGPYEDTYLVTPRAD